MSRTELLCKFLRGQEATGVLDGNERGTEIKVACVRHSATRLLQFGNIRHGVRSRNSAAFNTVALIVAAGFAVMAFPGGLFPGCLTVAMRSAGTRTATTVLLNWIGLGRRRDSEWNMLHYEAGATLEVASRFCRDGERPKRVLVGVCRDGRRSKGLVMLSDLVGPNPQVADWHGSVRSRGLGEPGEVAIEGATQGIGWVLEITAVDQHLLQAAITDLMGRPLAN